MISSSWRHLASFPRDSRIAWRTSGWTGVKNLMPHGSIYRGGNLLVIEQDLEKVHIVTPPNDIEIELFDGDVSRVSSILPTAKRQAFKTRFEAGRSCLLASRGSTVVGYTWLSSGIDRDIELLPLALPEDSIYLWELFVPRSERGSGIGSALTSARLALAREWGFRFGWRAVSPGNKPSMRTVEKTGSVQVLGELSWHQFLGRFRGREVRYGAKPILAGK
jgi:GNAT superfamily N-acetyltransferase